MRDVIFIIAAAFNEPLLLEPAWRGFSLCTLGREMGQQVFRYHNSRYSLMLSECWLNGREHMAGVQNDRPCLQGGERYCCTAGDWHAGAPAGWYAAIFRNDRL